MQTATIEGIYSLSAIQQGIFEMALEDGNLEARCEQAQCTLTGNLDVALFSTAWHRLLRSNEILRASFVWKHVAERVQVVHQDVIAHLEILDKRDQELSDKQLAAKAEQELNAGIDPLRPPLLRGCLVLREDCRSYFFVTYHCLILDCGSVKLLFKQLLKVYAELKNGAPGRALSELRLADYRGSQAPSNSKDSQSFWREHLVDLPFPGPSLLRHRTDLDGSNGRRCWQWQELPQLIGYLLFDLANHHGLDISILVDAVWAQLISRYVAADDIVFGKITSRGLQNPDDGRLERSSYTTPLPIRLLLNPEDSLLGAAQRLKEQRGKISRYDFAFAGANLRGRAGDWVSIWGSTDENDYATFLEQVEDLVAGDFRVILVDCAAVLLQTETRAQSVIVAISYESSLEPDFIKRIERHYVRLLSEAASRPTLPLGQQAMLEAAEIEQIKTWSIARAPHPYEQSIHAALEEQAERTPDAPAVQFGQTRLNYREVNHRANQLAHYLQKLGVGVETAVAICVERSPEMIIGLLGILKAGAVYVPIDPAYPAERTEFCIRDASAPVLLTQSHLAARLTVDVPCVICLDAEWPVISKESVANPEDLVSPDRAAYIMYTSGTTGTPKGVVVLHQGVTRLVRQADYVQFGADEIFLQLSPFTFDASTFEIWGSLLNGGTLVIMPPHSPTLVEIAQELEKMKVTKLWLTAGLFQLMVDHELLKGTHLREVVVGGDALSPYHVRLALEQMCSTRFVNGYGPTETTTFACCFQITSLGETVESVPIGRPIAETEAYVLDSHMRMVPQGTAGELFISGRGLARGYLNDPELTAFRFVPHPISSHPGSRLYRTGDRARFLPDGQIEFLGRSDRQVKIRGFRVELGEVEAVLRQHPAIKDVMVTVFEDHTGKRLAAYVTTKESGATVEEIQEYVRNRAPEFLVPARVIPLPEFPLTDRGKVDRSKLPPPMDPMVEDSVPAEPETALEETLAEIYRIILGLERVGVTDNFFVLGGDSMRSIQIISLAEEKGLRLSIDEVFRYQTIRELAKVIEARSTQSGTITTSPPFAPYTLISEEDQRHLPPDVEDAYPLTRLQAGMVFHSELSPHSGLYHDILSFHLYAPYREDLWQGAVQQLISRHEILRTSFDLRSYREPLQLVHREVRAPVETEDLRGAAADIQEARIAEWIETAKTKPFDWSRPPLFRLQLHRRTEDTLQLTLSFHHAILDGWSASRFLAELFHHYSQMLQGQPEELFRKVPVRFRDLVEIEQKAISSEPSKQYWQGMLAGLEAASFPCWPMRKDQNQSGSLAVPISEDLSAKLLQFAHSARVPIKSALFSAHLRVLSLVTGSKDVVTGFVTHGRPETSGADEVLGLFLNALPFRAQMQGGTWKGLAQEVLQIEQAMAAHRWYPMSQIQKDLGGEQIYDTAFTFTRFHVVNDLQQTSGLQIIGGTEFAKTNVLFAPFFQQESSSSQLHLTLDFDPDQLPVTQISAVARYYIRALETMVREPLGRYEQACLLPESERDLLFRENICTRYIVPACTVQVLFETRAQETPSALAVVTQEDTLTFHQLSQKSNDLARHLRDIGVGSEVIVGVCLDHCPEILVALLGILKAGGAFVSIDPAYPLERKSFILEDSRTPVVITKTDFAAGLPFFLGQLVLLDSDDLAATGPDVRLPELLGAEAAYLVYTSGSTGQPKGILVSHTSLTNVVMAMIEIAEINPDDRLFQFVSLNFDAAIQQIFMTLCTGASLAMARDAGRLTPAEFLQTCGELAVNTLYLPPAFWHEVVQWLAESGNSAPISLRQVLCGGEVPSPDRLRMWAQLNRNGSAFLNAYGPAEAAVTATAYRVLAQTDLVNDLSRVPMGRPIPNMQAFVLDEYLQSMPPGTPGELFLSGVGLARGYMGKPDLTAERFIPNPFSRFPGGRMYKTGDLARYLANGVLEFWGRADDQIKIRGYRVEPTEIEYVLRQDPSVRDAVVFKHESSTGSVVALIACVVPQDGKIPSPGDLIRRMEQSLPEYMVARSIFVVPEVPVTANGKTDYQALEKLIAQDDRAAAKTAPRNPVEEILRNIWREVLEKDDVSIHDNFFDLGGHSLLATQVASRVREALQKDLPLKILFETPTIAQVAEGLTETGSARRQGITPMSREGKLPLSFAQQRLWFLDKLRPGNSLYNVMTAVRLSGKFNLEALEQSLTEIVRRHEVLRTTFSAMDGEPAQTIGPALPFRIPIIHLRGHSSADRTQELVRLAQAEARQSFDLTRGPLLRATLVHLDDEEHVFLLTMHHIICDGWSVGILTRELAGLYRAFEARDKLMLPDLPIQYVDFAAWQREWLSGEIFDQQLAYWKKELEGSLHPLELPADRSRPVIPSSKGGRCEFHVSREVSQAVARLGRRYSFTNFMMLLTAFAAVLHRYTGRDDIVIGTDVANRTWSEVEGLIGFFVNQLVLCADLSSNPPFMELLRRIRKITLDAYAHQDFPFEKLVETLQPERKLNHHPLFQVKFVYQNAPTPKLELPELSLTPLNIETGVSRYDLMLAMEEFDHTFAGLLEYNSELFESARIERMAGHLQTLLAAAAEDPDLPVSELPLLTAVELQQLLMVWNQSNGEYEAEKCIHEIFEQQVAAAPGHTAIISGSEALSYADLNRRANQLANYMRQLGVAADVPVGLCLQRGIDLIVAILGTLKAGGTYVYLDPSFPLERLSFIIEDTHIPLILTCNQFINCLPATWARVLCLDSEASLLNEMDDSDLMPVTCASNLAYMIYTSGSAGKPKGALLQHSGVCNLARWQARQFGIARESRVSQNFSYNFDGAVGESFMALLNGATLVILSLDPALPQSLAENINRYKINVAVFVPSLLLLVDPSAVETRSDLAIVSVGETCPPELVKRWAGKCKFINAYGPTEYTVYSHLWQSGQECDKLPQYIPIGAPISNTRSYIVDRYLNLVPAGVPGEICVSGPGLARGYLNQSDVTAAKFLPNCYQPYDDVCQVVPSRIEGMLQQVEAFKRKRLDAPADSRRFSRSDVRALPAKEALKHVQHLSVDLQDSTAQFLKEYGGSGVSYDAFCRYLLEGANNSFSASGLNLDALKTILPFDTYAGLHGVELCFGSGEVIQALAGQGAQMIGLELNPFFVARMRERGLDARMSKVDEDKEKFFHRSGIIENSQDFAICGMALDRVERPRQLIENMLAMLREGGKFAIQTLLPIIPIDDGQVDLPITYTQPEHRIACGGSSERHKQAIIALLYDLGAGDVRIWEFPYAVDSSDGLQDYRLWSFAAVKRPKASRMSARNNYGRMYLTGDIGCYLPDGNIRFDGRRDDQIKIRGYRIELGEIEAVLRTHPALRKTVVIASHGIGTEGSRLTAIIVVGSRESHPAPSEVRQWLSQKLPDYMVPSNFVFVDDLPVLPSGKLDQRALQALARSRSSFVAAFVSPETEIERTIAKTWEMSLQLDQVGLDDNFFDIGGHSLLMVEVAAKLQASLQMEVTVTEMFEYPTVRKLARHLSGEKEVVATAVAEGQERALMQKKALQQRERARQSHF